MSSVKIRLLNNGGYTFIGRLSFPIEVSAVREGSVFNVSVGELKRIGASDEVSVKGKELWCFSSHQCQVVSSVGRKPSMNIEMRKMLEFIAENPSEVNVIHIRRLLSKVSGADVESS